MFYNRSLCRTTIDILPDDVLLEIFDFYQIESNSHTNALHPSSHWLRLMHVCQRWRHSVLVSPRRLNLTLYCTYGTPVRTHLGSLPPFPVIVDYLTIHLAPRPDSDHEDDIIAALEHSGRVRSVKLAVTSHLLWVMALVIQEPFTALTTLWLSSKDRNAPVVPDIFSIRFGPAPHLLQIFLEGISFPALPTLLLSASNLVDLQLKYIPQSGYIPPEAMASSLGALQRLDNLCIWFKAPISRLQLGSSFVPTPRHTLLSLVTFNFHGSSEYLEHLLAQIDTPRLRITDITYYNQLDFHVPQLSQFISRTEHLGLAQSLHTSVRIRISNVCVELEFEEEGHHGTRLTLCISCKWLDWQVLHLVQILGQSPAMVSNVEYLSIDENDLQIEPGWEDSMEDTDWLELLRPFTAVKRLHVSKQLARHIALALDSVGGETIMEVLPALASLSLEHQQVRSVEKFIAARQTSSHPVTLVGPGRLELMSCMVSFQTKSFLTALRSVTNRKVIQSSGSPPFFPNRPDTKRQYPTDLLVDGFIARTFASEDADRYLKLLLQEQNFLQYYGILHRRCVWLITHNFDLMQGTSPGVQSENYPLLDYSVTDYGTVVPQIRWAPDSAVALQQNVENAELQLPIFFVNSNGGIGFPLPDTLKGYVCDLHNANDPAPVGPKTTTFIRICVSPSPIY